MNLALLAFNRGKISTLALARSDFSRTALSAEIQTNWMPRALGSMMLRPGLGYKGATRNNLQSVSIPFIFAVDDTARLEVTDGVMRVLVDDVPVSRATVSTAVTNGTFGTDLTGWTDVDEGSAASTWATGGYMSLVGTGNGAARRRQQITVTDTGVRHGLDIVVTRGPVLLRVGSTAGGDEYISETTLRTGAHSLAFTPTGNFYVELFSYSRAASLVDSVAISPAGTLNLTAPWAAADLAGLRWDQSGDVVFVACSGYRQRRIERRAADSWSIVLYESDNGPFRIQNVGPVTLTPSATEGDATLTASSPYFRSGHIGSLFKITHTGQLQAEELTGADQFTDPIRVTGVDGTRAFAIIITGTWTGTITLQYSVAEPGSWVDADAGTFTANTAISYDDTLDNQVIYYRVGFKSGNYASGTADVSLSTSSGSQTGIARVTGYTSPTAVSVAVLEEFGSAAASSDWSESYWSDYRGYPSSVSLYEGRLWWFGKDRAWGSIVDAFASFDDEFEGDAGPISRSIGSGPVDTINWALALQRLLLGADGSIWSARSSSFDEPLTPLNFNLKDVSTQGSRDVAAVKIDGGGVFVQRSGVRVMEAVYDSNSYDYATSDLTVHVPEIGEPGIVRLAVQRQPETRVHCIRSDGTVAILVFDKAEDVRCWVDFETDGFVEDVCVLPGDVEDQVTYTVKRTVNGSTVRYHERWALESECRGATLNKQADSFVTGTASVNGLGHLEGETVVVWADGEDKGTFTVSGGAIGASYGSWVAGLYYEAPYKSTKLASAVGDTSGLCRKKKVSRLGIIAQNIHRQGLLYGPDFETMDDLPAIENGADVDEEVRSVYDEQMFEFPGDWETDARLCLKAAAPRPCTLLAAVVDISVN